MWDRTFSTMALRQWSTFPNETYLLPSLMVFQHLISLIHLEKMTTLGGELHGIIAHWNPSSLPTTTFSVPFSKPPGIVAGNPVFRRPFGLLSKSWVTATDFLLCIVGNINSCSELLFVVHECPTELTRCFFWMGQQIYIRSQSHLCKIRSGLGAIPFLYVPINAVKHVSEFHTWNFIFCYFLHCFTKAC